MTRLDYIEVEGYKSIRHAKVELGAINVLIGANGAGKSNLVSLFGLLGALGERHLGFHVARAGGANAVLHFGQKRTQELRVRVGRGDLGYEVVLAPVPVDSLAFKSEVTLVGEVVDEVLPRRGDRETGWPPQAPRWGKFWNGPQVGKVFEFSDATHSSPIKQKSRIGDALGLRSDGSNLAARLHALRELSPGAYKRIVEAVRSVAPFFDDFILQPDPINPDTIQLEWRHRSDDAYFNAHNMSAGTLRFACLATLLLQPDPPSLIVIDEPELGLHPFAISELAGLIRSASVKTQVLVATQSVTLLDQFAPEDVIVVERKDEESTFRRLDAAALSGWLDDYSLGDLWLKNVLGGRPR